MKNNFYNIPEDWYKEFNNTFDVTDINHFMNNMNNYNMNNTLNQNLATPKVALDRGNLFNNLYNPYKNYKYRELKPINKREELLFNVMKYKFAMKELNLYLDTHPNDTIMIELFNKYSKEEKIACNEYEKNFGPLTIESENIDNNSWSWIKSPWPWEGTR